MNPIEIGQAIDNYGIAMVTAIILTLVVWLVRYFVKQSNEDRLYYRGVITTDLVKLHKSDEKNANLNNQTIILQKDMAKELEEHNGHSKKAWEKTIESLGVICDRLNGGSPAMVDMKKKLAKYTAKGIIDRRNKNKKVKIDRRK